MTIQVDWDLISEGVSQELGPNWNDKLSRTGTIETGDWKIDYTARLKGIVTDKFIEVKVDISGAGIPGGTYEIDSIKFIPGNSDEIRSFSGFIQYTLAEGSYTLKLRYRAEDSSQTVIIDKARIQITKY